MIYVSSREFPKRATKTAAVLAGLRNFMLVSSIKDPSVWERVYEDLDGKYSEYELLTMRDTENIGMPSTMYMLVATPRGWRPAPWWGHKCVLTAYDQKVVVGGSSNQSCVHARCELEAIMQEMG